MASEFEDLIAWQKARILASEIYRITNTGGFAKDYGLKDQIRRASVSVVSNIAEGFDRHSSAEFHRFLVIAKGSCAEVRAQLYIALDVGYLKEEQFTELTKLAIETSKIINGLRVSVQRQKDENVTFSIKEESTAYKTV